MNNWVPKNKIIRLAVIAVLLSVILYFSGLFFVLKETKKLENLYSDTESQSYKEKKFLAVKTIIESNQESIQTLRNYFIQKGDEVKFIEQIEKTAKNSGVKFDIISIDVKTKQEESSFKEDVGVRMQIEGSWKNVMTFIDKLEKLSFEVSINSVNLDVSAPRQWSGSVEFVIFREK